MSFPSGAFIHYFRGVSFPSGGGRDEKEINTGIRGPSHAIRVGVVGFEKASLAS